MSALDFADGIRFCMAGRYKLDNPVIVWDLLMLLEKIHETRKVPDKIMTQSYREEVWREEYEAALSRFGWSDPFHVKDPEARPKKKKATVEAQ